VLQNNEIVQVEICVQEGLTRVPKDFAIGTVDTTSKKTLNFCCAIAGVEIADKNTFITNIVRRNHLPQKASAHHIIIIAYGILTLSTSAPSAG